MRFEGGRVKGEITMAVRRGGGGVRCGEYCRRGSYTGGNKVRLAG